jgi:hypothetical protein
MKNDVLKEFVTNNHLGLDEVNGFIVSTVKLPLFGEFETMVFGFYPNTREVNLNGLYAERYTNKEDAISGHERIVQMAENNGFSKNGE